MEAYIALIRKNPDTDYSVNFPDLPGCITGGETLDEAYRFAHEALELHLEGMREDGDLVPAPSDLGTVMADPENLDAVAILVEAPSAKSKSVPVTITMDERLLAQVDAAAVAIGTSRSGFLADAARDRLRGSTAPMTDRYDRTVVRGESSRPTERSAVKDGAPRKKRA